MDSFVEAAGYQEIELAERPFVVRGSVTEEIINIFGRKVNQGDPRPDDHPTDSTWIIGNLAGGGQVLLANVDSDTERDWWSTCDERTPGAITLPPETRAYTPAGAAAGNPWVLGDFPVQNSHLYVSIGTALQRWDAATDQLVDASLTLAAPPVEAWTVYRVNSGVDAGKTWAFIPEGTGYDILKDDLTIAAGTGGAISFTVWDKKLFRLTADGSVEWQADGGATWTSVGQISDGTIPRHLVTGYDRAGNEAVLVVTDGSIWILDFDTSELLKALAFPRHPDRGLGATEYEGLGIVVSVGMGTHQFDGDQVLSDRGLDRHHGLPRQYRGMIVDLTQGNGKIFALVKGESLATPTESVELDLGGGDDQLYLSGAQSYSVLMEWNGEGWHNLWTGAGQVPTNVVISQADDTYQVWFGAAGTVYAQTLSRTFFNPAEQNGTDRFAKECDFYTSIWNWGWFSQTKLFKRHELSADGTSADEYIEVEYRIDHEAADLDQDWVALGQVTTDGKTGFTVGLDQDNPTLPGGVAHYLGVPHDTIQFHYHLRRGDDPTKHPVVKWLATVARRFLQPKRTWSFVVDLTSSEKDYHPGELKAYLEQLVKTPGAVTFLHRGTYYMVDIVSMTFTDKPGDTNQSFCKISLIDSFEMV